MKTLQIVRRPWYIRPRAMKARKTELQSADQILTAHCCRLIILVEASVIHSDGETAEISKRQDYSPTKDRFSPKCHLVAVWMFGVVRESRWSDRHDTYRFS